VRLLGDWHRAEDVLVETFTKLARSDLSETGSLKGWLYRVATNACYKIFRKRRKEMSMQHQNTCTYVNDPAPDITKEIEIQKLLNMLPENQRIVMILKFYENMRYHEIAEVLCCPIGTVKSRMHEAIKNMRRLYLAGTRRIHEMC
jgi:RNA polymerase sigma-70 factor (ECF subfamily)